MEENKGSKPENKSTSIAKNLEDIDDSEMERKNDINPKHEQWALTINDTLRTINLNALDDALRYVLVIWLGINIPPDNPDSEASIQAYTYQPILLAISLFYIAASFLIRSRKAKEDTDFIMTTTTPPTHLEARNLLGDVGGIPEALVKYVSPMQSGTEAAIVGFYKVSTMASSVFGSIDFTTKALYICYLPKTWASFLGVGLWAVTCFTPEFHRWTATGSHPKHSIHKPIIFLRHNQFRNKKDLALYWLICAGHPLSTFLFQCRTIDLLFSNFAGILVKAGSTDKPSSTFKGGIQELPTLLFIGMLCLWFAGKNRVLAPKLKAYFKPKTSRPIEWINVFASSVIGSFITSWVAYTLIQTDNTLPSSTNLYTVFGISIPLGLIGALGTYVEHYKAPLNKNGEEEAFLNPSEPPRPPSTHKHPPSSIKLSETTPTAVEETETLYYQSSPPPPDLENQVTSSSNTSASNTGKPTFFNSSRLQICVIDKSPSALPQAICFFSPTPKKSFHTNIRNRSIDKEFHDTKQNFSEAPITI